MEERKVWIIGHKNPDTDSICAAICYAYLKNVLEEPKLRSDRVKFIPKRAGAINAETAYVLEQFGAEVPELVTDVGTQVKDISIRRTEGVNKNISMKKAWELMKILNIVTLPVVNRRNKLEGLIVTGDIATSYMDVYDNTILGRARTQYRNIVETLEAKLVTGNEHSYFVKGKVMVGAGTPEMIAETIEQDDLVLMSNSEDAQMVCVEKNCACLIITCGLEISPKVVAAAELKDITVISTPYDTFTAARLINQSIPIKYFMTTKDSLVTFSDEDYIDDVRDLVAKIRHRDFPVIDSSNNYLGMFSRRNLLNTKKKQIILVDHNEKSQAVNHVEEADILEIIDHHRIGSLETIAPVYFRNQPLGCTGTIIYQMYQEKGVEIPPQIAGLLCSAILSDTLMFRSPTCTQLDQDVAGILAGIAGINVEEFAQNMFEAGSDFGSKTEEEIINMDFKIFYSGKIAFGVSQVSAMGQGQLDKLKERLRGYLDTQLTDKRLDMMYVMLTNIRTETTTLIYTGTDAAAIAAEAFNCKPSTEELVLRGVVSRKKQMIPELMRAISERG